MLKETELFLQSIMREDRSILDLIDADFTFLNERLGRHYGIVDTMGNRSGMPRSFPAAKCSRPGVQTREAARRRTRRHPDAGQHFDGQLQSNAHLAGEARPLGAGADTRHAAAAAAAECAGAGRGRKGPNKGSLRQRMEQHRANPGCAFCHARMDPIGFAFENFNGIGKFRTSDGEFPIDPAGMLPNGQSFKGPGDLKAILKGKKELFARSLAEKMLIYGTGRGLEYYDRMAIDTIVAELGRNDYRFSVLVAAVVKSDPFRMRRGKEQK